MPQNERRSRVPVAETERPTVEENDRLTLAPILVIGLRAVFRRGGMHVICSLAGVTRRGIDSGIQERRPLKVLSPASASVCCWYIVMYPRHRFTL